MLTTTRWRPDTCDCILEYEWDTESLEDARVHTFKTVSRKCDDHAGLNMDQTHYQHVLKENQTKNKMVQQIIDHVPRLKKQIVQADGSVTHDLDPTVQYNWSFIGKDHQRQLHVDIKGANLTKTEKDSLRAATASLDKPVTIL